MEKKILICILIFLLALAGCSSVINTNPTAQSILKEDPDADILQYNNLIYIKATNLEFIKESKFTKSESLGEVIKTTITPKNFKDYYATKLATGTKIFSTNDKNTHTLIVDLNGKKILYTVLLEG